MSIDVDVLLRVLEACDSTRKEEPLISLVVPKKGGGYGQIFLKWVPGRLLKDYIRDPALTKVLSLYSAMHSRIIDHRGIHRRLTYRPEEGDELTFHRARQR